MGGLTHNRICPSPLTPLPLLWPSPPSFRPPDTRQKAQRFHERLLSRPLPLQRSRVRAALASRVGGARHLRDQKRRPPRKILRAGDVPLSVGAHPYRARAELH